MTAATLPPDAVPDVHTLEQTANASLFRRMLKNPTGVASLAFLLILVLVGIFANVLAPHDPNAANAVHILEKPSGTYLLGTDGSGHDILSRLLVAIQPTLEAAALAVAVSAAIGITAGLISGYYGKWFAGASSWIASLLMALPAIVVLLAARAVIGPSMFWTMFVFGIILSPAFYRVVHAEVAGVKHELYVDAARVSGLSDARIISRHILTVVRAPAIILAAGIAGIAIAIEAGLDFLGLGDLSRPTWGGMLNDAFNHIFTAPLGLLWPSLAIALTCMALTLLANGLRDELERASTPTRRRRRRASTAVSIQREPVVTHDEPATAGGEELLHVTELAVGYDQPEGSVKTVVQDVSLSVHRGEVHGLIGESGSGKTQTAFAIMGLLPPGGRVVGGAIVFEGADLAAVPSRQMTKLRGAKIAYIPQEPMSNLDPTFTIGSQLAEPMRVVLGIGRAEAKERALELLARVGIPDPERTFNAYPHQISGGMAQRVLIAGAISCNPDLLIADEPTTALDVTVQAEVLDLLRDLEAEFHMAILLVTHNFGVVADLCDTVSVMQAGRIVETGSVRAIFAAPRHPYTRSLFDAILEDSDPRGPLTPRELQA
jgi:ABC-type dipeptide/oligopeptide/nickel transport system ATPase component/ABC-type dipeptide/oligopeptide/nickel transport system permease subunit